LKNLQLIRLRDISILYPDFKKYRVMEEYIVKLEDLVYVKTGKPAFGDALAVIDLQNDFIPGGTLAVQEGDVIIEGINRVMELFNRSDLPVVLTQDWHPAEHRSFASAHPGMKPYDPFEREGIGPVLWPDHCVQGSHGADFHKNLGVRHAHAVIRKGYHRDIDSYSGFLENDGKTRTGLDGYLRDRGVKRLFICGLALDYCVFFTASHGRDLGYEVCVIADLARPVGSPPGSLSSALDTMSDKGVCFVCSADLFPV
jgi:nicotinamidase/pyrazinamidase